jgi:hypothetical protein
MSIFSFYGDKFTYHLDAVARSKKNLVQTAGTKIMSALLKVNRAVIKKYGEMKEKISNKIGVSNNHNFS